MSPFVRHYISHQNLRSLLKSGTYNLPDLDKVRGNLDKGVRNLNAYVRDALAASTNSSSPSLLIPPVQDPNAPTPITLERLEQRKKGKGPLTDLEIENAIGDLLDYFEVTFAVLKESLTPDGESPVSAAGSSRDSPFLAGELMRDRLLGAHSLEPRLDAVVERDPDNDRGLARAASE